MAALKAVAVGETGERGRASVEVLLSVIGELEAVEYDDEEDEDCPGCGWPPLSPAFANEHLATCRDHPAVIRARACRESLRLAPFLATSLGLEALPVESSLFAGIEKALATGPEGQKYRYVPQTEELRRHVEFLTGPKRDQYPILVPKYAAELEAAVDLWARLVHREADPCRFCGAVTAIEDAIAHAAGCEQHPAAVAAKAAEAHLNAQLGRRGAEALVKLVLERERLLDGLAKLIGACESFDNGLGWNGESYYARGYVEDALHGAAAKAARLADLSAPVYRPSFDAVAEAASGPKFARATWRALLRVGQDGPVPGTHRGTEADAALLRGAIAEADRLRQALGDDLACPSCARPGLWVHLAVAHVAACPLHRATIREREAEAAAAFASDVLREKRPEAGLGEVQARALRAIQRFWPPTWTRQREDGDASSRRDQERVEFLLVPERRAKYPTIVESYVDDVAGALSTWQRYRIAHDAECPYCGYTGPFAALLAHVAECRAHPSWARADAHDRFLERAGTGRLDELRALRRTIDAARIALARLAEYVDRFIDSFGDDERGRAIVHNWLLDGWKRELSLAREALSRLRPSSAA